MWRSISYSSACLTKRNELTFLTSVLVPNSFWPRGPHADVGVAAQRTFFHVAVADAGVEDDFLKPGEVLVRFRGRSHVRFADDLGEGHARAVQIDGGLRGSISEALVQTLARVFFQVQAGDADFFLAFRASYVHRFRCIQFRQRLVILRDLVALRQVRIEIVLPRKNGSFVDAALQAIAARTANSTAFRFSTGKAPGSPRHTGHTFVFGGSPKRVEHEQKIFEAVSSCTWTSSPMTGSYLARRSSERLEWSPYQGDYSWTGEDVRRSIAGLLRFLHFRRA
jgi:hypothetical protein